MLFDKFNFEGLNSLEVDRVQEALSKDELLQSYILNKNFNFIRQNYLILSELGALEENWMEAYTFSSNFVNVDVTELQKIFEKCNREVLQRRFPIPQGDKFSNGQRFSLFRGCAGENHTMGMSWTWSLDKAIWYAAHHAHFNGLTNMTVYTTVVNRAEIFCCGNHFDYDFIVFPKHCWKVDVPNCEFRLDRPR